MCSVHILPTSMRTRPNIFGGSFFDGVSASPQLFTSWITKPANGLELEMKSECSCGPFMLSKNYFIGGVFRNALVAFKCFFIVSAPNVAQMCELYLLNAGSHFFSITYERNLPPCLLLV